MNRNETLLAIGATAALFILAFVAALWLIDRFHRSSGWASYIALVVTLTTVVALGSALCYEGYKWLPNIVLGL